MKRLAVSVGLVGILLLPGCAGSPDLLQCQSVAALDVELEVFFDQDNQGAGDSPEHIQRLQELADEYSRIDVDGELKDATTAVSRDLRELYMYRIGIQNGDAADPVHESELRRTAIDTFVNAQTVCVQHRTS